MKFLLLLALPCYALDQATKWLVIRQLEYNGDPVSVWGDFFSLCHWGNTGAAFGAFHDSNRGFLILSALAVVGILVAVWRGAFSDAASRWGVGLMLGGVLGNLTDRILHGHVVDFLLFNLHLPYADPWPAFNVADICICVAAGLFIWSTFRPGVGDVKL
ncbi:MAG: signal peptidase [Verrucomicrobiota bacterium]|jgi:signal peptidase II